MGILVKNLKSYEYSRVVKGSSFIKLYDVNGFCFQHFFDISEVGFTDYAIYKKTTDKSAVANKIYYTRTGNKGSYAFIVADAFSTDCYEFDEYEIPHAAGAGTIVARECELNNGKLNLTLPAGIAVQNELQINFKTPVDSNTITHIILNEEEYELVDSRNISIADHFNAFAADSVVSVIIDMEDHRAAVQNLTYSNNVFVSEEQPSDDSEVELWVNPNGTGIDIDNKVIEGSNNLVTSDAVYQYVKNNGSTGGGSGSNVSVIDSLTSTSTTDALSANQGKVLNTNISNVSTVANEAKTAAANAQTAADTAQSTANTAKSTAEAALPKTGGTMTGNLILNVDPTEDKHAVTKKYVDDIVGDIESLLAQI